MMLSRRLHDDMVHSPAVREARAHAYALMGLWAKDRYLAHARNCRSLELANGRQLVARLIRRAAAVTEDADFCLKSATEHSPRAKTWKQSPFLARSIILKSPGQGGEKGVLAVYFEYNWLRLLAGVPAEELRRLSNEYELLLIASWSPTDFTVLSLAVAAWSGTIWIQPANHLEIEKLAAFSTKIQVLDSLACDWVNPDFYQPKPFAERSIDLLMIANWGNFKRHWEFFEALTQLPKDLRVVLIGQKEGGRTMATIQQEAKRIGVPQRLEMHESLPIDQVTTMQCNAKVSVLMSRREGGCVAAVESLFAGCALAMRADAHVGSRAHINPQTGALLRPGKIADDLRDLLVRAPDLRPREWAIDHISCQRTTEKLNARLKTMTKAEGRPWTKDLVLANWRPHPTFATVFDQEDMLPAYHDLNQRFPGVFPDDLWRNSWR
jgi:glycosyltransferase involved in cell wall biosynthesis